MSRLEVPFSPRVLILKFSSLREKMQRVENSQMGHKGLEIAMSISCGLPVITKLSGDVGRRAT